MSTAESAKDVMSRPSCSVVPRFVVVSLLVAFASAAIVLADEPLDLHLDDGLVTVEVTEAPISAVIRAIGEQAGFETILVGHLDRLVSASFAGMPVREALERLLGNTNRIVVSDANRTIVRLWLLGSSSEVTERVARETELALLEPDLRQADPKARSEASLGLANLGATQPVLDLLTQSLLEDEDALVRSRAAIALGKLADQRAVPALESALSDDHGTVRTQVLHALGLIGGERATLALGEVLLYGTKNRERVVAAQGLAGIGTDLARQYLGAAADDPDQQVRALSNYSPGKNKPYVIEIPEDDGATKWGPENSR
jgi:hypothetical protein